MTAAALISLRETLETSLVIGMILAVLPRAGAQPLQRFVWLGVVAGILFSLVLAFVLQTLTFALPQHVLAFYEGALMIVAACLLTWMLFWVMRTGKVFRQSLQREATMHALSGSALGIFLLSFTTTMREGTEMAIFLQAAFLSAKSDFHHFVGILLGITGALLLTALLFRSARKFSLNTFFACTTFALLFFAAHLIGAGMAELLEAYETENIPMLVTSAAAAPFVYIALVAIAWVRIRRATY